MIDKVNCLMIGWGPHATRTYSKFFIKYQLEPRVVVDLESQRVKVNIKLIKKYKIELIKKFNIVFPENAII